MKKKIILAILFLGYLNNPVSADTISTTTNNSPMIVNDRITEISDQVVDCFNYYTFNSVQTDIITASTTVRAGDNILFNGFIYNNNPYPVVNGDLYIKVFKKDYSGKNPNGPDVVDQFFAVTDISIPASSSTLVSFYWKVPSFSESGNYRIASFFIVDKKFNLLGLSFTDDVIGNPFDFEVSGVNERVFFDKSSVSINDTKFYFAAFPVQITKDDNAIIKSKIVNETKDTQNIEIISKLYKWDSVNPANFISETKRNITVDGNSSTTISFEVKEKKSSVYLLVEELKYKDTKSILNIRFVRRNVDNLRLNFPSILEYPIKANSTSTVFSCLHNGGTSPVVRDGKIKLQVLNRLGIKIGEYTYSGVVTGDMMAVKGDFFSKKELKNFFVKAELWQGDKLVDESKIYYSCNKINPGSCDIDWLSYLIIIIIALVIILPVLFIRIKRNKK
jgi:hypothetical protein